ncbi:major facilitator superfamily MFS_1 [Kribbella flavida DSM 17836]|uniref:Major facilitator superfamily MFS_1 n=1 Tax=Kribbella flavida (strain DSM 17836 / JCM 10339 / NBRC 14399) TaxID=479435 RepID=D2PX31_KRIFD|nr:MFS transporter [Kribbella flavida]ADB35411.1 major facilitator superfamily MFS_1 [Kribbella flavida DSM 17836]
MTTDRRPQDQPLDERAPAQVDAAGRAGALQRRTLQVLVISNVVGGVAVASGFAVAGLLAENISGSTSMSGLVATSTTLGAAVLAVPLAGLARRRGRRVSLATGYLIAVTGAVLSIVAAQVDSLALLLIAGCLFGSGSAANLQSRYAATDAADPRYVARSLSVVVWATTIGVVVGPNLTGLGGSAGAAVGVLPLAGPYLFSVVAFALSLATVWFGLRRLQLSTPRTKVERQPLATTFRRVMAIPHARLGLLAIASAHSVMVGVMSMTAVHLRHHGASLTVVGFVISGHVAGMYALSPVMGWLADRLGRIPTIGVGLAVLAVAMAVAALAPDEAHSLTALSLVLLGIGWSACLVAGSTLLSYSVPADIRTSAQGLSDLTMGALASIAGTAAGPILAHLGFHWLAVLCALLLVPVAVMAALTPQLASSNKIDSA